ncbi:hypothetical protein V3C99_016636 [Haemonchus contortus]|uniref:Conserved plasma membrane protein n=1 Tax=Haemonchus contortus TaxID=6289 RepID=A0A7I4YWV2_HAECO
MPSITLQKAKPKESKSDSGKATQRSTRSTERSPRASSRSLEEFSAKSPKTLPRGSKGLSAGGSPKTTSKGSAEPGHTSSTRPDSKSSNVQLTPVDSKGSAEIPEKERKPTSSSKGSAEGRKDEGSLEAVKLKSDDEKPSKDKNSKQMEAKNIDESKDSKELLDKDSKSREEVQRKRKKRHEEELQYNDERPPEVVLKSVLESMEKAMSARERSETTRADLHSVSRTLCGIVLFTILLVMSTLETFIGATTIGTCPFQPIMPIWLIIFGVLSVLFGVCGLVFALKLNYTGRKALYRDLAMGIMTAFWLIWFILGSYYVYDIYNTVVYEQGHPYYCYPLVYKFTIFIVTVIWVIIGIACCCVCYCVAFLCCHNSSVVVIT